MATREAADSTAASTDDDGKSSWGGKKEEDGEVKIKNPHSQQQRTHLLPGSRNEEKSKYLHWRTKQKKKREKSEALHTRRGLWRHSIAYPIEKSRPASRRPTQLALVYLLKRLHFSLVSFFFFFFFRLFFSFLFFPFIYLFIYLGLV